jgi:hypothetical protein
LEAAIELARSMNREALTAAAARAVIEANSNYGRSVGEANAAAARAYTLGDFFTDLSNSTPPPTSDARVGGQILLTFTRSPNNAPGYRP